MRLFPVMQPVAQVASPPEYAAGYTAVTTRFPSGREQFTTFHPCAAFSSDCLLTAHMYFAWGMHGIIPGSRDSLFSVQVPPPLGLCPAGFIGRPACSAAAVDQEAP